MTRVIKVGGRPQQDPALPLLIARAVAARRGDTILVHGGGDELTALQRALGAIPRFVGGRRVTTASDVDLARMALSGTANKRLVAALAAEGVRALGLSGEDGGLIAARPTDASLGYVGMPVAVNVALLELLLRGGYLPVISPVSRGVRGACGPALNVNADDAAAAVAAAVGAEELLLVSDVASVSCDGAPVEQLSAEEAVALLAHPSVTGGMRAKLQAAAHALDAGVDRVRISDLAAIHDPARGTALTRIGVLT